MEPVTEAMLRAGREAEAKGLVSDDRLTAIFQALFKVWVQEQHPSPYSYKAVNDFLHIKADAARKFDQALRSGIFEPVKLEGAYGGVDYTRINSKDQKIDQSSADAVKIADTNDSAKIDRAAEETDAERAEWARKALRL